MDKMIFIGLGVVLLFLIYKNFSMYKRIKLNKNYVGIFNQIFKQDNENAYADIANYIAETENEEFKNKGRIFKLFIELRDGLPYENTLADLDFTPLFYEKDKADYQKISFNSDTFVWIITVMTKASKKGQSELIDEMMQKLALHHELLANRIEYVLCKSVSDSLKQEADLGIPFMRALINGDYEEYKYDTRLIGIYKKIATAFLAYNHQELGEYEIEDIRMLASSLIGTFILQDLDMYEEYGPKAEVIEDENLENSEEPETERLEEEKAPEADEVVDVQESDDVKEEK